ncbi:conserved virulence factor C family protein [Metabacillus arenae]|uniref:Conserved virulence factor C family protein n=1 Tax=Metabacillus arenae TaxID=2771434 RepID=A0A926NPC3_9BACI|nr:conserved virulence factor C family protein [Metabacillus arenae]MBD1381612.1 conserved virulence factor C family protein [Metabacillus arenae]
MKINSIEPTPSPNTMKVILNQELPAGKSNNYKKSDSDQAPELIKNVLLIEGVKGVYHVADFLAVERNAKFDWKEILPKVRAVFGEETGEGDRSDHPREGFGEIKVFIQMFNGIPMQVKLTDQETEKRYGLSERFQKSIMELQKNAENVVLDRHWKEQGVRYGDYDDVGREVVEEIEAAYHEDRLTKLVKNASTKEKGEKVTPRSPYEVTLDMMQDPEWKNRYAHLEQMNPSEKDIPVLEKALEDSKASIRRLATVYLGMIETDSVLPYLYKALEDKSVTVRRTAGDCLSDLGNPKAIPVMKESLKDPNKLVRWRAAMFLYEVGDDTALPALKDAENDPEFEVSLQIKMAVERIEGGEEAKGSVWKQMTENRNN